MAGTKRKMKKIILDTNFILLPTEYRVDIFSEIKRLFHENIQIFVLEKSMQELNDISLKGRQKERLQVKLAKELLKTQNIKILSIDQEKGVDDILVDLSKTGYIIATQDKELRRRIKHKIIILRQGRYLVMKC